MIIRKAFMIALHLGHSYTEEGGASPVPGGSWLAQVRRKAQLVNQCFYCEPYTSLLFVTVVIVIITTVVNCPF